MINAFNEMLNEMKRVSAKWISKLHTTVHSMFPVLGLDRLEKENKIYVLDNETHQITQTHVYKQNLIGSWQCGCNLIHITQITIKQMAKNSNGQTNVKYDKVKMKKKK